MLASPWLLPGPAVPGGALLLSSACSLLLEPQPMGLGAARSQEPPRSLLAGGHLSSGLTPLLCGRCGVLSVCVLCAVLL